MSIELEEELWRTFQSKFAKLLNDLPREEQKEYFYIFGMREEFEKNFDLDQIETRFRQKIKAKKTEKKRTKYLRKLIARIEVHKQKSILKNTSRTYAKSVFENKDKIGNSKESVFKVALKTISNKTLGCEYYPCHNGK